MKKILNFINKPINERGDTLPGVMVSAIISGIILIGLTLVIGNILQTRTDSDVGAELTVTATNLDSAIRSDVAGSVRIEPVTDNNVLFHIPGKETNECKIANWKANTVGDSWEVTRELIVHEGITQDANNNIVCDTTSPIIAQSVRTLSTHLNSINFVLKNEVDREVQVDSISGLPVFADPLASPPANADSTYIALWNNLTVTQIKLTYEITTNTKTQTLNREVEQRSPVTAYSDTTKLAEAVEFVNTTTGTTLTPTGFTAPTHMIVNQDYTLTWNDNGVCPAGSEKRYNVYRDGNIIATQTGTTLTDALPSTDTGNPATSWLYTQRGTAQYAVATSCVKGGLEITSPPATHTAISVLPTPPQATITLPATNDPSNLMLAQWTNTCHAPSLTFPQYRYSIMGENSAAPHSVNNNAWTSTLNRTVPNGWGATYEVIVETKCVSNNPEGAADSAGSVNNGTPGNPTPERWTNTWATPTIQIQTTANTANISNPITLTRILTCGPITETTVGNYNPTTITWGTDTGHTLTNGTHSTVSGWNSSSFVGNNTVTKTSAGARTFTQSADCEVNGFTSPSATINTPTGDRTVDWTIPAPTVPTITLPATNTTNGPISWSGSVCETGSTLQYRFIRAGAHTNASVSSTMHSLTTGWGTATSNTLPAGWGARYNTTVEATCYTVDPNINGGNPVYAGTPSATTEATIPANGKGVSNATWTSSGFSNPTASITSISPASPYEGQTVTLNRAYTCGITGASASWSGASTAYRATPGSGTYSATINCTINSFPASATASRYITWASYPYVPAAPTLIKAGGVWRWYDPGMHRVWGQSANVSVSTPAYTTYRQFQYQYVTRSDLTTTSSIITLDAGMGYGIHVKTPYIGETVSTGHILWAWARACNANGCSGWASLNLSGATLNSPIYGEFEPPWSGGGGGRMIML